MLDGQRGERLALVIAAMNHISPGEANHFDDRNHANRVIGLNARLAAATLALQPAHVVAKVCHRRVSGREGRAGYRIGVEYGVKGFRGLANVGK